MTKGHVARIAGLIVLGIMIGRLGTGFGEPDTVYVTRPAPAAKTVEVPKEVLSPDCRRALDMAVTIRDQAGQLDSASGPQIDVMSKAQEAIQTGDFKKLSELAEEQRQLQINTLDEATVLQSDMYPYNQVLDKCISEVPK
jgi:hypothetical protein